MRRTLTQRIGTGIVWLDIEPDGKTFVCSWRADGPAAEVLESERVQDEAGAVAWGRSRTPCVAIRMDSQTLWAGDGEATVAVDGYWGSSSSERPGDAGT